jgi:orotidine-5'-phosphate decarboxylase
MPFIEMLNNAWSKNSSLVCVGLDPDLQKIPGDLLSNKFPIFEFNKSIIDATADLVCAYKPQIAYYSAKTAENQLEMTIQYIHKHFPEIPVILDAKRNDIGSTAAMYAEEAFDRYQADALTVNPYLGQDALDPFIKYQTKGIIILCRTSNPGARQIQDLLIDGEKLYQRVARLAIQEWNYNKNILLVVGATYPKELKEIRDIVGDMPLLVPGIGAQGGDVKEAVMNGKDSHGSGMIINASRSIIYASKDKHFAAAARKAAQELRAEINQYR